MTVSYRSIDANDLDRSLCVQWRTIASNTAAYHSPYFTPEFTQAVRAVRNDVRVVVIENGDRVVGFFPYQRNVWGIGAPVGGPLSDYHGVVAAPGSEWDVQALMVAAGLSVWAFDHLAGETTKFAPYISESADSPQADLSRGYDEYVEARRASGSDFITKTEATARRLARDVGQVIFNLHEPTKVVLGQLAKWKSQQYRRAGIPDAFAVAWTRDLLNIIAQATADAFAGVCSVLRAGDRIVAVHLGMRSNAMLHYWFPAYDVEFAKYSPGSILLIRLLQNLPSLKTSILDFGKGDAQYKLRLMTHATPLYEGVVECPSLISKIRRLRRAAEAHAARGWMGAALRLPLKVLRRIERSRKYY